MPLPASLRAAQIARAAGRVVVWSPAPAPEPGPDTELLLAIADWVLPNEAELRTLTGAGGPTGARALRRRCRGQVLATLGESGAVWVPEADGPARTIAAHRVRVVDTVGAGDAFTGALAARLAVGEAAELAAAFASAAGALACTAPGALPALPYRAEIAALARTRP